ncbi:MAG: WxL domain-containing protein [Kurthia sp.]|nr:WxL domain-containing protein [Candidatus Kurthia equi]
MKKIIILFLSIALVSSSLSPFIAGGLNAKANESATLIETTIEEESLNIDILGEETVTINPNDKEFTINVTKNSKLKDEPIIMKLPEGLSYEDNQENINFNKEESELSIYSEEEVLATSVKLMIDEKVVSSKEATITAILGSEDKKITSNELKMDFSNEDSTHPITEQSITTNEENNQSIAKDDEKATQKNNTTPEKQEEETQENTTPKNKSTKSSTKDNGNGWTTLEGVPNAPKPEKHLYADPEKANEVDVTTWAEFDAAVRNTSIEVIFIQNNIMSPNNTDRSITPHNIDIKGNGFDVDFKNARYYSTGAIPANTDYKVQFNNMTIYGADYYGPFNFTGTVPSTGSGALVYNDITYVGAQLTASYTWDIEFKGKIDNHSVERHTSPMDGSTNTNDGSGQENIEAQQIIFHDNTHYTGSTPKTRILDLQGSGGIDVGKNAYINLTSGSTVLGTYYAVNLQGTLNLGENSEFIINDNGTPGAAIQLSSANSSIIAGENSKFIINEPNTTSSTYSIYMPYTGSSINLKEGAEMNLNATDLKSSYPVLYLGNQTSFIVESGAKLNINANNKTYGAALVQVYGNADFIVKDHGEFNVHETNKGTTGGNIIDVGANSKFIIGKKATFDITSDGSANHNLINLGTNSTFQFADAEKVNMQFTNDKLSTSARLIAMGGSAGTLDVDVQDVKAWNRTNISENDVREADYHWTPMFGMITQYSTGTATVKQAESVMNSVRDDYTANFKTQNYSRLLYSYIEDVEVGIMNEPNDNADSADSSVIHGVANPGAYVRLTGDDALPEPKIPSIVDGSDNPELTDDYTVIADENGKFTVHAKEGEHFTAANDIKAYAFLGGKMDEDTFTVLDKTAPTAEGKTLTMADGTDFPTAKKFLTNEADTNPTNEGYTYEFKEDYSQLAHTPGTHQVIVVLTDDAGNSRDIPATLDVVADEYVIEADDFTINISDLKQYDTTEKLHAFLLEESKANAFGIIDFETQDLTDELQVTNTDSIENFKKGKYDVTLELLSEGKTFNETFTVTVLNDEAVAPTNPEKPGSEEKPTEQENEGTGQNGLLKLDYAPSTFDFGTLEFGFESVETNAVKTASEKQWLQVSDDRGEDNLANWSIQVSQNHALENTNGEELKGATITVPEGTIYTENAAAKENLTAEEIEITSTPTTVFSANVQENTKGISTNVWDATDVKLSIPGNQEFEEGTYSNEITWALVSEPEEDK